MDHLQTEARNPASTNLDELTALQIVYLMSGEDARVVPAVAEQAEAIARVIDAIADRLRSGGRLVYVGAGTSGRLGVLDATECPPTFNSPLGQVVGLIAGGPAALTRAVEGAEDHPEFAERDLAEIPLSAGDVLVGIATSGRTPYVLGAAAYARRLGCFTVGLSCNPNSAVSAVVDLAITPVVGPEVLSGSTRLKAGTATKLVLNMLTTGAMVRLGKTFGNLMVDLRITNTKLRARTNRIVRILTGLSADQAAELLERCGGELKTALVTQLAGVEPEEARSRLQAAAGQVRDAVGFPSPPVLRGRGQGEGVARYAVTCPSPPIPRPRSTGGEGRDSDIYLGIDGGGTHTIALLATPTAGAPGWSFLGRGEAGPSNLHAVGTEKAFAAINDAVGRAFTAAARPRRPVAAACLGLAGAGRPDDQALVLEWARGVGLAGHVEVVADAALLLAAGTPGGWGVALVAGTGSMAYGRSADGRTARAGGWGSLLGDEGSAYAIVVAALRAVARAADGRGAETSLVVRFLTRLGLKEAQEIVTAVHRGGWDRTALAGLAPLVLEAATEDAVAGGIVDDAAHELALVAAAVARKLALEATAVPLALAGGMLLGSERHRTRVLAALESLGVPAGPVCLVADPAEGAVRMALALSIGRGPVSAS